MSKDSLKDLMKVAGDRCHCDCGCEIIHQQYNHSLARFNDVSAHNSAAAQSAFTQAMAAHHAHLLKLQHDITKVDSSGS